MSMKKGHLTIGGCDTVSLAQEFSTPLFVMDEDAIRKNLPYVPKLVE